MTVAQPKRHCRRVDFLHDTHAVPFELVFRVSGYIKFELVVEVFGIEYGVTKRCPTLTDTTLDIPGFLISIISEGVAVVVDGVVAVCTVEEQTSCDVLSVSANLEVFAVVRAGKSTAYDRIARFRVRSCCGKLEATEFASVACSDIPDVILTPRGRERETAEGWRVIADDVERYPMTGSWITDIFSWS